MVNSIFNNSLWYSVVAFSIFDFKCGDAFDYVIPFHEKTGITPDFPVAVVDVRINLCTKCKSFHFIIKKGSNSIRYINIS